MQKPMPFCTQPCRSRWSLHHQNRGCRQASLKNNFPEKADALYQKEIADVKARYAKYRKPADDAQ